MAGEGEPSAIRKDRRKLCGEELMLRKEMTGALATFGHKVGARRIEKHNSFRGERTNLGYAERQDVDTGLPCDLRWRCVEPNQRVRKTRAIHVNGKRALMRNLAECCDLSLAIDGPDFSGLRDG